MTPAQFLIDENIPPCIVNDLERLLRHAKAEEAAHLKHVHTLYGELGLCNQGVWDEVWVPHLKQQDWVVLAGDLGKNSGKGQKLPSLCVQLGLTHILLSPAVHNRGKFQKFLTILSVWHELIEVARGEKGRRYYIEPLSAVPAQCGRGKLVQKAIPLSEPPPKGLLFRK